MAKLKKRRPLRGGPDKFGLGPDLLFLWIAASLILFAIFFNVAAIVSKSEGHEGEVVWLVLSFVFAAAAVAVFVRSEYANRLKALFGLETLRGPNRLGAVERRRLREQLRRQATVGVDGKLSASFKKYLARFEDKRALLAVVRQEEQELRRQLDVVARIRSELERQVR